MFRYVALIKLTPEGRERLHEAPKILEKVEFFVEEQQGRLVETFAMMGPWDFFAIVEYPTVEQAFRAHAKIATLEVIEVETFPVEEVERFIEALG
ncbi:MAG TPA: GYD domain-containing protein [Gaiellaceae bacterium]|nr:GYD domain-containing protein [Gaiellaceae bacterium]